MQLYNYSQWRISPRCWARAVDHDSVDASDLSELLSVWLASAAFNHEQKNPYFSALRSHVVQQMYAVNENNGGKKEKEKKNIVAVTLYL